VTWPPAVGTWLLDLDGVIWLSGRPIEGVDQAVADLHRAGIRTLFVTNNAGLTVGQVLDRLHRAKVSADAEDLVTSAQAAATLLEPGQRVLPVAQGGALEALRARGISLVDAAPADAVVVGYTNHFDYERLTAACRALRGGARLVGTNDDATYPTPDGLVPGAGSLLAAVATAGGVTPEVAGKPHAPMATLVRQRAADVVVMVGDRPSTDGLFAERLGVAFALVLSGVTAAGGPPPHPTPAVTAPDFPTLVRTALAG
jgi:glycerol 3-phosphatase-2